MNQLSEVKRCSWPSEDDPLMISYHDEEWGVPLSDDHKIFEFLTLESFQAGLSWKTILHKRENFRMAFAGFDYRQIACLNAWNVANLLNNPGIIRNRQKIEATIHNAGKFLEIQDQYGSFASYMWSWVNDKPVVHRFRRLSEIPPYTSEAETWAKDLKRRGFKFFGPTVIYAHMQAVGMVNDHTMNCFRFSQLSG
jgi:DNA-3-methyladenine glycosylase I